MISSFPSPAAPPEAGAAPGRRLGTGATRPRSSGTPDFYADALEEHLTAPSPPHESRPNQARSADAPGEPPSGQPSDAAPKDPGPAPDDGVAADTAAAAAAVTAQAPPQPQLAAPAPASPTPLLPAAAGEPPQAALALDAPALRPDAADDSAEAPAGPPLLPPESEAGAQVGSDAPRSDAQPAPTSVADPFPALLRAELTKSPPVMAGPQEDMGSGSTAPPEPPTVPPAPADTHDVAGSPGTSGTHAPSFSTARGEHDHPSPPPLPQIAGNPSAAAQPPAEPIDGSHLGTGRAEAVTLPDLPLRLARLAGRLVEAGPTEMRLRLDPPSLGELRILVGRDGTGIHVRIVAQSHETLALLAEGQPRLREELERSGLALESFSTAVDDGRRGDADDWTRSQHRDGQNGSRRGEAADPVEAATALLGTSRAQDQPPGRHRGLDARV